MTATMAIPKNITLLKPWEAISDTEEQQNHTALPCERLKRDLPGGHVLSRVDVKIVARRIDKDDVLCELEGAEYPLAVVHMTWRKETDPRWPRTRFFRDWQYWVEEAMLPDHDDFTVQ
jgi:hypothetical protein